MSILWKIFGNDENPKPPDWFMQGKPQWLRTVMWYMRNPLHNFFWHVIGFKDKPLDYTYYHQAGSGGTLPSTASANTNGTGTVPAIYIRYSNA